MNGSVKRLAGNASVISNPVNQNGHPAASIATTPRAIAEGPTRLSAGAVVRFLQSERATSSATHTRTAAPNRNVFGPATWVSGSAKTCAQEATPTVNRSLAIVLTSAKEVAIGAKRRFESRDGL